MNLQVLQDLLNLLEGIVIGKQGLGNPKKMKPKYLFRNLFLGIHLVLTAVMVISPMTMRLLLIHTERAGLEEIRI